MSNYNSLKTTIDANIKQNGNQEITGQILNSVLNAMVNTLGAGYQFAGVATTATNPGTPDAKVFYIANGKGTYTNFGGLEVTEDEVVILYWDSSWHKVATGIASNEKLSELASQVIYDVSANNDGATFASLSALLLSENLSTLIPTSVRCGGMSIRFIQSTDNKYVQYRLMNDEWITDTNYWAIADEGVYVENPEFIRVVIDNEDKILEAIRVDGTKLLPAGVEINKKIDFEGNETTIIENPEFTEIKIDDSGHILWGIQKDGNVYFGAGVPQQVIDYINERIAELSLDEYEDIVAFLNNLEKGDKTLQTLLNEKVDKEEGKSLIDREYASTKYNVDNPEFLEVTTDSEDKIIAGRTPDGAAFENKGFSTPKASIDGHIIENIEDPEGRIEITTDSDGKILSYRSKDGVKTENAGLDFSESAMSDFQKTLLDAGLGVHNWSNESYIYLPEQPKCAVINISGINKMPSTKSDNLHAYLEVWDKLGNYFKKKVILNAQGRSSLEQTKKNFGADFCEDDWKGDDTTTIKIGNWVSQDSFHFKAYYTDLFKFANVISYKLWNSWKSTMPIIENEPYKEYFADSYNATTKSKDNFRQNTNDEARCTPDGFPVMVYLNGEFYGLFSWQLKKHRDNYSLDRNSVSNIHLDGEDYTNMFSGNIKWNLLEIRNPKPKKSKWTLTCMDGSKYDGDSPKELIDDTSDKWDSSNTSHIKSAQVKANIVSMSNYMSEISVYEAEYNNAPSDSKASALSSLKEEIEKRFSVKWMIDCLILFNLENNGDSIAQNTQWITWGELNGKMKWYPCPYDLDGSFGISSTTSFGFGNPHFYNIGRGSATPFKYIYLYYREELELRWRKLRDTKLVDKDTFMTFVHTWINNIGYDNFKLEYDKWNESPCNRDSAMNAKWGNPTSSYISYTGKPTDWFAEYKFNRGDHTKYNYQCFESLQDNNIGHLPDINADTEWWKNITIKPGTYNTGDVVWDGRNNFYKFIAQENIVVSVDPSNDGRPDHFVNAPFTKLYSGYPNEGGVYDSIYRIYKWIEQQISILDSEFNYSQN